jgi:hypothetical protein
MEAVAVAHVLAVLEHCVSSHSGTSRECIALLQVLSWRTTSVPPRPFFESREKASLTGHPLVSERFVSRMLRLSCNIVAQCVRKLLRYTFQYVLYRNVQGCACLNIAICNIVQAVAVADRRSSKLGKAAGTRQRKVALKSLWVSGSKPLLPDPETGL